MDGKTFKANALRTESYDLEKIFSRLEERHVGVCVVSTLKLALQVTSQLDQIKKFLFYGKESPYIENFKNKMELMANFSQVTNEHYNQSQLFKDDDLVRLLHGVMGKVTEDGELIEALFKSSNGETDSVNWMEELGDGDWYSAIIADTLDFELDEARDRVIAKLKKRFPDRFTENSAINRDIEKERETLEGKEM